MPFDSGMASKPPEGKTIFEKTEASFLKSAPVTRRISKPSPLKKKGRAVVGGDLAPHDEARLDACRAEGIEDLFRLIDEVAQARALARDHHIPSAQVPGRALDDVSRHALGDRLHDRHGGYPEADHHDEEAIASEAPEDALEDEGCEHFYSASIVWTMPAPRGEGYGIGRGD